MKNELTNVISCPRKGKFQVLQLNSSVKIIRLMIEVTNVPSNGKLAEDAHQAALNVTIPDALRYSGVRSAVRPLGGSTDASSIEDVMTITS